VQGSRTRTFNITNCLILLSCCYGQKPDSLVGMPVSGYDSRIDAWIMGHAGVALCQKPSAQPRRSIASP
jgi:hypothetical protein